MLQLVPLNLPVLAVCAELEWERFLVTFKVIFCLRCNLAGRIWHLCDLCFNLSWRQRASASSIC